VHPENEDSRVISAVGDQCDRAVGELVENRLLDERGGREISTIEPRQC